MLLAALAARIPPSLLFFACLRLHEVPYAGMKEYA